MKKIAFLFAFLVLASCAQVPPRDQFASENATEDADATMGDADAGTDAAADAPDVPDADVANAQDVVDAEEVTDAGDDDADTDSQDAGSDAADAASTDADGDADAKPDVTLDVVVDVCAGKNCDDGVPCTTDSCTAGTCVHLMPAQCDDKNVCTTDWCNAAGCQHADNAAGCDDGDACTTADLCSAGQCKGVVPVCGDGTCEACETLATCAADCETPMVTLPAGTYAMGSAIGIGNADEQPQHQVTLSEFNLDKTEVTVTQYTAFYDQLSSGQKCSGTNSSGFVCGQPKNTGTFCNWGVPGKEQDPVNCIDWFQADAYCKWAHEGGRLPTEAEWEYAASSGGKNQTYPWGNAAPSCAIYAIFNETGLGCGKNSTWPTCSKTAGNSSQGACDLAGNVWEWCEDWYGPYASGAQTNPTGVASGVSRVIRGGSWINNAGLRAADRGNVTPDNRNSDFGIRCVKPLPVDLCANVTCTDLSCATQACNPATGQCVATAKGNGTTCDDGNTCTTGDTCQSGTCAGTAISCADAFPCTTDTCNTSAGCVHTAVNSACDDGIACTTDACSASTGCSYTVVNSACDDSTTCTTDTCSATTGCVHVTDGTTCNDGNSCTSDVCTSGGSATGCTHSNLSTGTTCDDGNACTAGDKCSAGVCSGAGPVCGDSQCTCGETTGSCAADCTSSTPAGMVLIPAGTFWMGCNSTKDANCSGNSDENPQHKVTLSAYYMDLTETTVGQYKACVDAGVCTVPSSVQPATYATYPGLTNNPVNFVTWTQSMQYCWWRGAGFNLPTEAQWEMAARGSCEKNGSTAGAAGCAAAMRTYPWGEAAATCSYAVMYNGSAEGCGTGATWAVGSKTAGDSPYALHDMAGNVWEWNRDWYSATYYSNSPAADPYDSASASNRVGRGGGFGVFSGSLRAGSRDYEGPSGAGRNLGLRCMWSYATTQDLCAIVTCPAIACATNTCDPGTGKCVVTVKPDATACDDGNACTSGDVCKSGVCKGAGAVCGDGACTCTETAASCAVDCACGNGTCDGDETVSNCPADCGFLVKHLGGACTTPGSKDTCDHDYFCVARSSTGGGDVCVADFSTWSPIPDAHPASDFTEATDYVTDKLSGLSWAKAPLAGQVWSTALTACNTATYGGFTDWRVPTRAEMLSLTNRITPKPACSGPNVTWPTDTWDYWSSVPRASGGASWLVHFDTGSGDFYGTSSASRVRCVRAGASTGAGAGARFATQDSGATVLDRISGLHWQQGFSSTTMSQSAALTQCSANTMVLPGTGWRLPTSHELEDLADSQTSSPAIDAVFAGTPSDFFWSATPQVSGGYAWDVYFGDGRGMTDPPTSPYRVRCVR